MTSSSSPPPWLLRVSRLATVVSLALLLLYLLEGLECNAFVRLSLALQVAVLLAAAAAAYRGRP